MKEFRSGFVSIIGKTNVGKSTLINHLVGEKVAIITPKTQTTRNKIRAIANGEGYQIVFIDTPGVHKPKSKLGEMMVESAVSTIPDVDLILFTIEATSKTIDKENEMILEKLKKANKKAILVINKIDLIKKEKLLDLIDIYSGEYDFEDIIPISALSDKDIYELLYEIKKHMPIGPAYYDIDEYTNQTTRQLIEEIIREKALKVLEQEVPHGIYVEVERLGLRKTAQNEAIHDIISTIYCLKKSHKGIIIGENGRMLKRIGTYARLDMEKMLNTKVNLKLWVKVKEDWQENNNILKRFESE